MRTLVIALVFSVLALATSAPAQTATLTMLPEGFEVYDLSGNGRVVVGWVTNVTPRYAATWTREAGLQPIPKPAGWGATLARAVNHDGTVIAGEAATPEGVRAFVYTAEAGMVSLGVLPGAASSNAVGISSNGRWVCGGSGGFGMRYDRVAGVMEMLRVTPGEEWWAGIAVSDNGIVVGDAVSFKGARTEPTEWPTPIIARQLGPGLSNVYGSATDITPDGRWVVGTTDSPYLGQLGNPFPRMWDQERRPIELIAPGTPFVHGVYAMGLTDDARLVIGQIDVSGPPYARAGFWTSQTAFVRAWDYLVAVFGVQSPLGEPHRLTNVSDSGRTIVVEFLVPSLSRRTPGVLEWTPPCRADCELDWNLDIFDYLCFMNKYVANDSYACQFQENGGTGCDILDFFAFQDAFVVGCYR